MSQKIRSICAFVLVFAFIFLFHSHCRAWQGKVVGMLDADLFLISHESQTDKVKLYGIECPKKGQPYWQESRKLASHLVLQKIVEVTPLYRGHNGLENAMVRIDGVKDYLNLQLISYGLAWVKPDECSANICAEWRALENLAHSKSIGLWMDPNPIPPWLWEKEKRQKIQERRQYQENTSGITSLSAEPFLIAIKTGMFDKFYCFVFLIAGSIYTKPQTNAQFETA